MVLERTATAQAVEGGNQELKSDREEVEKMEGMLWRARAMVVQVAKAARRQGEGALRAQSRA